MNLLQNFPLAVIEYLYCWHRAVPLQTFTTRHSNRKLSIVVALSTTFMRCAPETTKLGKITQNKGHFAVPIESSYTTSHQWLTLTYLLSCSRLVIPPIKLSTVGSRAFPVAAAQVWNGLPEAVISSSSLQSFRRQLKTHLFQLSYPHLILWLLIRHRYP